MHPLSFIAAGFMCGIVFGDLLGAPPGPALAGAGFLLLASVSFLYVKKHTASAILLFFVVLSAGAAVWGFRNEYFRGQLELIGPEHYGKTAVIEGVIASPPSFSSFTVSADSIVLDGVPLGVSGRVGVLNRTEYRDYDYGDYVRVRGVIRESFRPRSGLAFYLGVYSPSWIEPAGRGGVNPLLGFALAAGGKMEEVIDRTMPEPESFFLKSILLGRRHHLPAGIRDTLTIIGTGHFLSVSGLHAGLVLIVFLAAASLAGLSGRQTAVFCIFGLLFFCLMTGARTPTVRAVAMASVVLAGGLFSRQVDRWNALALAALLVLVFRPEELFGAGFQLSFTAVAGIFYLYPAFSRRWKEGGRLSFLKKPVLGIASIHLAVSPLIAFYYGYLPLVSPAANFVLIPLLSMIAALGLCAGVIGIVWILPAQIINAANWGLIRFVLGIAEAFSRRPGLLPFDGFSPYLLVLYYGGLLMLPAVLKKFFPEEEGTAYAE